MEVDREIHRTEMKYGRLGGFLEHYRQLMKYNMSRTDLITSFFLNIVSGNFQKGEEEREQCDVVW